ncbi:hypothetical protein B0O99DRAFT_695717 [Bisporella sp. PMI_857]|nr:hypothetical protein B0O99DRAFT_695717 [Bisporella sp. PMI_857]
MLPKQPSPSETAQDLHHILNVGTPNPQPDSGSECYPLNWLELKLVKASERNARIVRRLNYITDANPFAYLLGIGRDYQQAREEARRDTTAFSMTAATQPLQLPLEELKQMFPMQQMEAMQKEAVLHMQKRTYPNEARVREMFDSNVEIFRETEICKQIKDLARYTFKQTTCKKIVAFGGGTFCSPVSNGATRLHYQHAMLIVLREVWEEMHKDHAQLKIPIFIQDPQYLELDAKVAAHYGMEVVNGNRSHQFGFVKVDEETMVVDQRTCFPLLESILEYTRPAAILSPYVINPDKYKDFPLSLTLRQDDRTLVVPESNIRGSATTNSFVKDYKEKKIRTDGLDCGQSYNPRDPNAHIGQDGENGFSYLGASPTMYVRRQ